MQFESTSGELPVVSPMPIGASVDPKFAARGLSIRQRLTLIVLAAAIPMALLSAVIVWWLAQSVRETQRDALMYASRTIMSSVDAHLGKYVTVAQMLATSPALQRDDLVAFREEAERVLPGMSRYWVVLGDANGQQLVNTFLPADQTGPHVTPPKLAADATRPFETRQPHISDVIFGPAAKIPVITVGVPVFHAGKPAYSLKIAVDVSIFRDLLDGQRIPKGWSAALIDGSGNFVARSGDDQENWVGKPVSADWRSLSKLEGAFEYLGRRGHLLTTANVLSPLSKWSIAVSAEKDLLDAPAWQTFALASLAGLAVTVLSVLLAACAARRITVPIRALEAGARALERREPVHFSATRVEEVDRVLFAFDTAAKALLENEHQRACAEAALKGSEEQLRLLIDGTKDYAVFMLDPEGRVASWNEGAHRIKGYEASEIIGRHFSAFYVPEDVAAGQPKRALEIALRAGRCEEEGERVKKDGAHFWANVLITPLRDDRGKLKGFSNITRDITERKRAEDSLRNQAALLNLARDAILVRGTSDVITFWSRGAEQTYGWTAEEAVGRVSHDLMGTRFPKPLAEICAEVAETGQWDGELIHFRKDGREMAVASRWVMQRDKSGRPMGVLEINRDTTKRKRDQQELAALAGRLRATVDTAADAIVVIDDSGIVQSVNPAVERIFGYRADEIVGKNVNLLMPEPWHSAHDSYISAYIRTGNAKIIGAGREVEAQRKDGKVIPIDLGVSEWRMAGKRYFTGMMRDITERKQAEQHVRFVMHELSHRTKNVLAVVQSMARQTARTSIDLDDFGRRFASRIEALACSHDLLTKTEWQGVHLEDLVRGQLHLFGAESRLDAHGPDLVLKPAPAQSLGLALHELATNASKYGALSQPSGRIEVGWSIDPEGAAPRQFRMHWRESGGPQASPPERNGFGCTVIKDMTERALKGAVALEFRAEGLLWQFTGSAIACLANAGDVTLI